MVKSRNFDVSRRYREIYISLLIFLLGVTGMVVPTIYGSRKMDDLALAIGLSDRQQVLLEQITKTVLEQENNLKTSTGNNACSRELIVLSANFLRTGGDR